MATTETAADDADPWAGWEEWRATKLYHRWYSRTQSGDPDDFLVVVTASSHTGVSGTGKSTILTVLGQEFDTSPDGFDATQKATVDVRELAYDRVPEVPDHSAVVADEIQGLVSSEGLDSRRAMRQSSIDALNAILGARDRSLTVILGAQQMSMLDSRLYPLIDAWLMIKYPPSSPYGPLALHHDVYTNDYNLRGPDWKTPVLEELTWPRIPHDDPDYAELTRLKHEYRRQRDGEDDAGGELPKEDQMELAQEYRNIGKSLEWIDNNVERITYSRETVRKNTVVNDDD